MELGFDPDHPYDHDDPPPRTTWDGIYWYFTNRAAENAMRWLRMCGLI